MRQAIRQLSAVTPMLAAIIAACGQGAAASEAHRITRTGWRTSVEIGHPAAPGAWRTLTTAAALPPAHAPATGHALKGIASYYTDPQKTATGEAYDPSAMTAAHRTLPFGTRVRVTDVSNQNAVVVRINDRGPFLPGRVIDLSLAAARVLGMHGKGLTVVRVEVVD